MTALAHALVDTSVFIALESGRTVDRRKLPDRAGVSLSVVTLAELTAGVLAARDTETRIRRMATLDGVADIDVVPVDQPAAVAWARLRALLEERNRRLNVNDLWIAATALSRGIPVVTQDDDFEPLEGASGLQIIRV